MSTRLYGRSARLPTELSLLFIVYGVFFSNLLLYWMLGLPEWAVDLGTLPGATLFWYWFFSWYALPAIRNGNPSQ